MSSFDFLYHTDRLSEFGDHLCYSGQLPHAVNTLVAKYPKSPEDGDGQPVEVWCEAWPAMFFEIRAQPAPNSVGEMRAGFSLSTGSGCAEFAALAAKMISEGMLGIRESEGESNG